MKVSPGYAGKTFFAGILERSSPTLNIVRVSSQLATCLILLMMYSRAFSACDMTISFNASLRTTDVTLIAVSIYGFSPCKFAGSNTVTNTSVLMVLTLIHTGNGLSVYLHNDR